MVGSVKMSHFQSYKEQITFTITFYSQPVLLELARLALTQIGSYTRLGTSPDVMIIEIRLNN